MMSRLRRIALLALATLGLAAGARAENGQFQIAHWVGSVVESNENVAVHSESLVAKARYGYDVASVTKGGYGSCKWNFASNTVAFYEFSFSTGLCNVNLNWKPWVYTLKYDSNGGTWNTQFKAEIATNFPETVQAYDNSACAKEGYALQNWNTKQNGSGDAIALSQNLTMGTPPISNETRTVTLYAQWKANDYTLCLRPGKGIDRIYYKARSSGEAASSPLEWKSTTTSLDVPVACDTEWKAYATARPGYDYTDTSETNPKTGTMKTAGASFEPYASPRSISLSFNGNGDTSGKTMSAQTFTVDKGDYLKANEFARGYKVTFDTNGGSACDPQTATYPFKSWNDAGDGSGPSTYTDQQMVTNPCGSTGEARMLYAQWDLSNIEPVILPTPSYAGHSFGGWYADSGLTKFVGAAGASYTPTNNATLYAGWDVVTHAVTFYDGDPDDGGQIISGPESVPHGAAATEPEKPTTKTYYKCNSWNTEAWRCVTEDLRVHAVWAGKRYAFQYNSNYRNGQVERDPVIGGRCGPEMDDDHQMVRIQKASTFGFAKKGHAFSGWHTDAASKVADAELAPNDDKHYSALDVLGGGSEDVPLYAIWSPNSYTVHFDGNGATGGSMSDQAFKYDQAQALAANGFTREGQTFLRWHDAKNNADYTGGQVVSNLTATADDIVTLTAVWSNYHYVRFDRNGATNETEMALQTFSGAETNALSANVYGKVGYTFAGWATNAAAAADLVVTYTNRQAVSFPLAQANETNILYAVWATNRYTIVFDPGTSLKSPYFFGTMAPLTNCVYDTPVTVRCGYTNYCSEGLLGWSTSASSAVAEFKVTGTSPANRGNATVVSNLTAEADGEVKLHAVWKGVGELAEAAGLSNAVLVPECIEGSSEVLWQPVSDPSAGPVHSSCAALTSPSAVSQSGKWILKMKVVGAGKVGCVWYWKPFGGDETTFRLYVDGEKKADLQRKVCWTVTNCVEIAGEGEHTVYWEVDGSINNGTSRDVIRLDDITWTPGAELKPGEEMPTYETKEAAEAAAETARVTPPNDEVAAVVSAEDYNDLFEVRAVQKTPSEETVPLLLAATPDAGEWTLAIQLKPSVSNEVQAVLDVAETNLCSVITNNPISVSFPMKAGLYYGLAATNEVEWLPWAVPAEWVLGRGIEDAVSAPRPSDTAAYYELRMSVNPAP